MASSSSAAAAAGTSKVTDFGPHVPEDKVQYRVQTPYGEGLTLRTRKATQDAPQMRQIELVKWKSALEETNSSKNKSKNGVVKPALLYSLTDFPSVAPQVNDEVMCTFGRGKVIEIRVSDITAEDGTKVANTTVVVLLSSWRLASRSRVKCYLQPSDVRVVRSKKIYEMTVHERVEAALAFKDQAAKEFGAKNYKAALESYARAIDAVRYVQHKTDSDNYIRADLLVVMVTCTNNAGMCARHLGHWEESMKFGKNAEVLLDALEQKTGLKIHTILVKDGFPDVKIFGEWKVKSIMLQARALAEKQEFDQVFELLKKSHDIIASYTTDEYAAKYGASVKTLRNLEKEVKKLHTACKERKAVQLKKEKQRAAAMFGGSSPKSSNKTTTENGQKSSSSTPVENGISKEKENHVPNGISNREANLSSPSSSDRQSPPTVGKTLPLKDSSESAFDETPIMNGGGSGKAPKRRVSFSEKVTSYEIPDDDNNSHAVEDKARAAVLGKKEGDTEDDEIEWYKDQEVLLGLAIFGGAVVASSFLVNFMLRRR